MPGPKTSCSAFFEGRQVAMRVAKKLIGRRNLPGWPNRSLKVEMLPNRKGSYPSAIWCVSREGGKRPAPAPT